MQKIEVTLKITLELDTNTSLSDEGLSNRIEDTLLENIRMSDMDFQNDQDSDVVVLVEDAFLEEIELL